MDNQGKRFERFRQRVYSECPERLSDVTVPILGEIDNCLKDIRSGVLLQIGELHFLITAAHRIKYWSQHQARFHIAAAESGRSTIPLFSPKFALLNEEVVDIAIFEVDADVARHAVGDGYRFMRISDLLLFEEGRETDLFVVYGYPLVEGEQDSRQHMCLNGLTYLTIWKTGELPSSYERGTHFLLDYDKEQHRSTGEWVQAPRLHGISGGGIWYAGDARHLERWEVSDLRLVGIQHRCNRPKEYVMGTHIGFALQVLWENWPATQKVMLLHGITHRKSPLSWYNGWIGSDQSPRFE